MLTLLGYGVLALLAAAVLFILAAYFLPTGEQIAPPLRDDPLWQLPPEQPLTGDQIETVRLPVSLRGYRFAEVDQLLDRLGAELRARDEQIAQLRGEPAAGRHAVAPADPAPLPSSQPVGSPQALGLPQPQAAVQALGYASGLPVSPALAVPDAPALDPGLGDERGIRENGAEGEGRQWPSHGA